MINSSAAVLLAVPVMEMSSGVLANTKLMTKRVALKEELEVELHWSENWL